MHKTCSVCLLFLPGLLWLAGCGGGGVASGLSGGSVPLGGRAVTGTVLLPDATPVANTTVTLRSLTSGQVVQTTSTDNSGRFVATGVPVDSDLDVVVMQPPSNSLEAIIPQSNLASNPGQPLDIGEVNALSTVVAAALKLEQNQAPEDFHSIVSNQHGHLTQEVHGAGYSLETQRQLISDPGSLKAQALTLMVPSANTELTAFVATPNTDTASTALNGLLGYVRAAHEHECHLSGSLRTSLINAQLAGKQYTADMVASALQKPGGPHATATEVSAASQRERSELTALGSLGSGITPFEALVIAADVNTHGGFQLDQRSLEDFLTKLLNN